jgi:hypothetical protein
MMTSRLLPALLAAALLAAGCGTVSAVRPLRRDQSAVALSLGGPVTRVSGMDIPLPYAVLRYRYGASDRFGLYCGGHLTQAALGNIAFDGGFSYHFLKQDGLVPAAGGSAGIVALLKPGSGGETAVFPQVDLAASWLAGNRFLTYCGLQTMYQFNASPNVALAPFVGEEVRVGRSFSLALEAKWFGAGEPTEPRTVDYRLPLFGSGAVGFVLGANWHPGGWYE